MNVCSFRFDTASMASRLIVVCSVLMSACVDLSDPFITEGSSRLAYSSATVPCATDDGCPTLGCRCKDKTEVRVLGCLIYACMDDEQAFCHDYCLNRGGEVMVWAFQRGPCEDATDRLECLICRSRVSELAQAESCADTTAALSMCLDRLDAQRGLFVGVRSVDWLDGTRAAAGGPCEEETNAYLACMEPHNPSTDACDDSPARVRAPLRPYVPEPDIPAALLEEAGQ